MLFLSRIWRKRLVTLRSSLALRMLTMNFSERFVWKELETSGSENKIQITDYEGPQIQSGRL